MSRQGFACHSIGTVPLTLLCDFPQFNFRMKQRDISEFLFYFISLFHFHFFFPPQHVQFFYWAPLALVFILYGKLMEEGRGFCRRLILLLRFISLETNCPPTFGRTFCANFKELFGHWSILVLHMCVWLCVCVLTWSFIRSSSAYATNFSFRLRCVPS